MAGASQAVSLIEVALREPAKNTLRRNFNLVELCMSMHGFGVGKRFARKSWEYYQPSSYFTISRIVVKRMDPNMKRAKVFGHLTFKGITNPKEIRATSVLKREWELHDTSAQVKFPDVELAKKEEKVEAKK